MTERKPDPLTGCGLMVIIAAALLGFAILALIAWKG